MENMSSEFFKALKIEFKNYGEKNISNNIEIPLQDNPIGIDEISEAVDSLLTTMLVMGEKTKIAENGWSKYVNRKHSVFVNSGTSALLIAMMSLRFKDVNLEKREIIIPATTWSTSLFPAIILGLKPVLVDISLENLCVNNFEEYINKDTAAILPVHLMGHACDLKIANDICKDEEIIMIEDCCEAHGAISNNKQVGEIGDMAAWSFMFAHHITSIEGGMVSTNCIDTANQLRAFRAHGWIRETSDNYKQQILSKNPLMHPAFIFPEIGLNLRPTEISSAFFIHQLKKLNNYIKIRQKAYSKLNSLFSEGALQDHFNVFNEMPHERVSPFAYPVMIKESSSINKIRFQKRLYEEGIDSRLIAAGNLSLQPFMKKYGHLIEMRGPLENSGKVFRNGFFIGLNQATDDNKIDFIVEKFKKIIGELC